MKRPRRELLKLVVVIFVAADPHPFNGISDELTECAMMIAYAHGKAVAVPAFEFLET